MKCFQAYLPILLFLLLTSTPPPALAKYAKPWCRDRCGNVTIPFPFGIGAECSVNQWYIIECTNSIPYLSALNRREVLNVSLTNLTVTVGTPRITGCRNQVRNSSEIIGVDLDGTPFLFSKLDNKFVFKGCGIAAMHVDNGSVVAACSTACHGVTVSDSNNCFGNGCCQTTIPHYLKSYNINITGLEEEDGSALLVDETSYDEGRSSDSLIPISLLWTLADSDHFTCCNNRSRERNKAELFNGTMVDTLLCYPLSDKVNPYLIDGCSRVDPEETMESRQCRRCIESGGRCKYDYTYYLFGPIYSRKVTCDYSHFDEDRRKTSLGVILGVSISMGVLFLIATSLVLYKLIKKAKERRQRKRFFKRNGGLLLKQQEETDPSLVDKTILFTSHELKKATDNFNENRILGRGGQGTVYKGMLVDGRIVAVKTSKIVDESQLEQFINEVVILSQVNHRNVVKLLGCCLETDVPLLVSEFIPNGTLYERLHNGSYEFPFSLSIRLQIATEVAGALAYLHSATSIPIYHRDIKTTNILLDEKYRAKVSDFGTSRLVSVEQTHLTTLVKGTFGYLDPEYFQSSQFTEKSDVYSFGVVLIELLTGERPISLTRFGETRSLVTYFTLAMKEGRVMSVFDATVIKEGTRDDLLSVANLAIRCLNMNGKYRPTMKEVAIELETRRTSHTPSTFQAHTEDVYGKYKPTMKEVAIGLETIRTSRTPSSFRADTNHVMYGEELSITYGESSSTFVSLNDNISQ
ncbi:putative protein kinase RLK-Pelle-WAK family [Helianthus debilis subsp. tardiflorus]